MAKKAKSRTVAVRLISMAMTGYYKTLVRPRLHRPLSMIKYDPIGKELFVWRFFCGSGRYRKEGVVRFAGGKFSEEVEERSWRRYR
ncbi:hypothetical protein RUND412_002812 [Rhizina undulata]